MNFILALLVMSMSPKEPQAFYYNGRSLVRLGVIQMPNVGHAELKLFVNSPYELRGASVDSSEVQMCLPQHKLRTELKLTGRWYVIAWETRLRVGSIEHTLYLTSYTGRVHRKNFVIAVEGSRKLDRPQGIKR